MLAFLFEKLGSGFDRAEQRRLTDYLASSSDLAEVERRMRELETHKLACCILVACPADRYDHARSCALIQCSLSALTIHAIDKDTVQNRQRE